MIRKWKRLEKERKNYNEIAEDMGWDKMRPLAYIIGRILNKILL